MYYANCVDFHCALAVSTRSTVHSVRQEASPQELRHAVTAYHLVNVRLSGDLALSDETIAVVVALTIYERLQKKYHNSMLHFQGLSRMVELRGGISQLTHNPGIVQKLHR